MIPLLHKNVFSVDKYIVTLVKRLTNLLEKLEGFICFGFSFFIKNK